MERERLDIPCVIGGEEVRTGDTVEAVMPHRKNHVLADVHQGGAAEVDRAIKVAADAWQDWSRTPWEERAAVLLRAAELLAGPWRTTMVAATMLNQSKTAHQAEIDAACELIDFFRFNVEFMTRVYAEQPVSSAGVWNRLEYRPLEGFVFAVSPFNFTAIGGNLTSSPALMGNTILWKPASTAALSAHYTMKCSRRPACRPGWSTSSTAAARRSATPLLASPDLAGIHFTGSTAVFQKHVEDGRQRTSSSTATTRGSSARRAARTSSSRTPPPTWTRSRRRSSAARSSTRARSAPPRRACTRRPTSGRSCASGSPSRLPS